MEDNRSSRYRRLITDYEQTKGTALAVIRQRKEQSDKLKAIQKEIEVLGKSQALLLKIASEAEEKILDFVSDIVSKGISDIFARPWQVVFKEEIKAGQKTLGIYLKKDNELETIPDAVGGGVTQTVSILMRIVLIFLLKGKAEQLLVIDEALSHLAETHLPRAAEVIQKVATDLKIQIIMITHQEQLLDAADSIYQVQEGRYEKIR